MYRRHLPPSLTHVTLHGQALQGIAQQLGQLEELELCELSGVTDGGLLQLSRLRSLRCLGLQGLPAAVSMSGLGVLCGASTSLLRLSVQRCRGVPHPLRLHVGVMECRLGFSVHVPDLLHGHAGRGPGSWAA